MNEDGIQTVTTFGRLFYGYLSIWLWPLFAGRYVAEPFLITVRY